ncbi:MAG: 2OG-Fe(II) oxygenase [Campylobacterales bacterium]
MGSICRGIGPTREESRKKGEVSGKKGGEKGIEKGKIFPISQQIGVLQKIWELDFPKGPLPFPYALLPFQIFRGLFSPGELEEIITAFHRENGEVAGLVGGGINRSHRNTLLHTPTERVRELFYRRIEGILPEIESFFGVRLVGGTDLQLLEYRQGGFYDCHADNASFLLREGEVVGFKLVKPERQITTLLFLNREFEGGELEFCFLRWLSTRRLEGEIGVENGGSGGELFKSHPLFIGEVNLNQSPEGEGRRVILKPEPGMLIVFPSGGVFAHQVHPVRRGRRFTLVKWWATL